MDGIGIAKIHKGLHIPKNFGITRTSKDRLARLLVWSMCVPYFYRVKVLKKKQSCEAHFALSDTCPISITGRQLSMIVKGGVLFNDDDDGDGNKNHQQQLLDDCKEGGATKSANRDGDGLG